MELNDLYHGPLDEFIARRAQLVRDARTADPDAVAALRALRKPPVSTWAIDQLAAGKQHLIAELLAAGADARVAQRAVADQAATRESLLIASSRLRDAVEEAARAADSVLENTGRAPGEEIRRRIRTTLQSAATGGAADRLALWRGTLDHDVESAGFGDVDPLEDEPAELVAILAPLRRVSWDATPALRVIREPADDGSARRDTAERAVQEQEAIVDRMRKLANAKRAHADAVAEEARVAAEEASAAEHAAEEAERDATAARSALKALTRTQHRR